MALLNKLYNIVMEIFIIFLSFLVFFLGYPILFGFLFAFWICKQIAIKLAQKDPKIGNILQGIDGAFAGKDPYNDPLIVLMPYYSLADKLDIPTVIKVLKEKVIAPNLYPELTQRIVRKYGYHFWYSVDNFKVENHVRHLQPECPNMPVTRAQLRDMLTNKLGKLPFDPTMSPWEILVVSNMIDDRDPEIKSVFILRVNHCLMDGYSIANFLHKVAFKPWKMLGGEKNEENRKKTYKLTEIYQYVMLLLLGPYHLFKMFVFSNDTHQFVRNTCKPDFEEIYNSQCTPTIADTRLKSIKNAYGVSMSSLITTLFGQATWKYMRSTGIAVSNTIHGMLSFPLPGHGNILSNHWSLVRIPIKVNEDDPMKTLKLVEKEFQSLRNSVKPLVFLYCNKMIAMIPLWLRMNSNTAPPTTFVLTNFPGPAEPSDIFGCRAKQISLGGKPARGISFITGSFSIAGKFWLDIGSPVCNIRNQRDADVLCETIMDTIATLEAGIAAN